VELFAFSFDRFIVVLFFISEQQTNNSRLQSVSNVLRFFSYFKRTFSPLPLTSLILLKNYEENKKDEHYQVQRSARMKFRPSVLTEFFQSLR